MGKFKDFVDMLALVFQSSVATNAIESDGIEILKELKTKYQKQHFDAIRQCKHGVILCNFDGYIGLNTKAELIYANAYNIPIFAVEPVKSQEEEIRILNIQQFNLFMIRKNQLC